MEIIKRNGVAEPFNVQKISLAIKKSFASTSRFITDDELFSIISDVEQYISDYPTKRNVESIQDKVEKSLMAHGFYDEAKSYILFRDNRSEERKAIAHISELVGISGLDTVLVSVSHEYKAKEYSLTVLSDRFSASCRPQMKSGDKLSALVKASVELTTSEAPSWEMISSRLFDFMLNRDIEKLEAGLNLHSFYDKVVYLTEQGLYGDYILRSYTSTEIEEAAAFMQPDRDHLLNYSGLDLLVKRYLIRTFSGQPVEKVQEMFLGIALHLAMPEKNNRLEWVRKIYDLLSCLEVTMATPTMSNARKPCHQLSSCFIDTVPDSLEGIYRSIGNFSQVSKFGGGMGMYFGKVRAMGGNIRGFHGVAGGVIRWIKLVNDTAVAVDQLGMRQGAVAVYLDVWHKDLPEFLQIRTNNGDDRMKAHDVFPAVCFPDLFWKMAEEDMDQSWYLFCPNEIMRVKGFCLEDYYGEEWETLYKECVSDRHLSRRVISIKDIIRLVLRSAVETGTPFVFNRDTVNRANPNPHQGMIYCSNLCTEIAQNMAPIESLSKEIKTIDGDTVVVNSVKAGEFVVCNLASLTLGRLPLENKKAMTDKIETVIRALDNVIDLNFYPVPFAEITNHRYRSIGLGVSGYHHALAKRGIKWESEEHLKFADKVFEMINYAAIEASCKLAKEKGAYKYFKGSDWQTGAYFKKRGYESEDWRRLAEKVSVNGMRNAYLLAVAPTSSTSIIAGTTAGLDPVMKRFFLEEKKGVMLPRVAPDLSDATYWMYKGAYLIDQKWSIRAAGVRQRHIDQSQSVNLYITNNYTMRQVLNLYLLAWKCGVKTLYYVRSKSLEVEECESCSA
ncbi:MAG: ribonucleoside-diphosphate reductase subunit alpha [Prevotella sp.]|nr:ribonucleoside-diphosphate reductase subunit alpha [Prevotella sp.]MCH4182377.1 ribonucleoside-diphosphate reductase subunit alpha [Prevotella sp.]MCH4212464.1 ribonucleoside-diphosphate reductase subunit alpha [Prevotella sp.]MCH4240695.1 ribonucleoside-diphosphate reductase subunit alpha [Prevotella sp.]